jgi:hypothetical protein
VSGALTITAKSAANRTFNLSWTDSSDVLSGGASYKLVSSTAGYPACSAASIYSGKGTSFSHGGLMLGKTYYYRVCVVSSAGKTTSWATAAKKVLTEYDPPTGGSVLINSGADYTKSTSAILTISASDTGLPMQMCVSNGATCTSWIAYATTKAWTLTAGNGTKTVKVWFRDKYGNTTPDPVSDSIILNTNKLSVSTVIR